jgi:AraC-like DNA-binding protein
LEKQCLDYAIINFREVELREPFPDEKLAALQAALKQSNINIEIIENQKSVLVQQIKDTIVEMIFMEDKLPLKTSSYLSQKLKRKYNHLSTVFSNDTYTSIETFILMQKTERAKQLLSTSELNITEISHKLNYSSTAHFSSQFKKMTGLTPTAFQRILSKRRTT